MQIMRHESDDSAFGGDRLVFHPLVFLFLSDPILIDTGMTVACIRWNHTGTVLAVARSQVFPVSSDTSKVHGERNLLLTDICVCCNEVSSSLS